MKERNEFLERGGLFFESETHEWFTDKNSTDYARKNTIGAKGEKMKDKLNVMCFVVRNKESGEYNRVMIDDKTNQIIYETKSLEGMAGEIDRLKIIKRFR